MLAMNIAVLEGDVRDWVRAHEALSRLARERAIADAEEGRWLLEALRSAAHVHLGFGSFGEYVERLFGYGRRCTQEKLRVAAALEHLPALAMALDQGALSWSAVREITRVAVPETERAWLQVAFGKTVRQLEELVAGRSEGDTPQSPPDRSARRHVLRFEVTAETLALFRQALAQLRHRTGASMDDDAALMAMARDVLGGPSDDGRASYQIALAVCAACGAGSQEASGELVPVGPEIVAMASCDGQQLGRLDLQPANDASANGSVAGDTGAARERAHVGAALESEQSPRSVGPHVVDAGHARGRARAKQTIPPAVRRAVLRRDHRCCRIPGCRNATFLDLHHIDLRSEGGRHHADNLVTVCGAHHRALHRGELAIEGTAATNVHFQHANGSPYGEAVVPKSLETQAKVFGGLRNLGFRESAIRRVLAELRQREALTSAEPSDLLRAALQRLTSYE